jgi:hypothetical protein
LPTSFDSTPMKLGNADGGKASYQLPPILGAHLLHTEVGMKMETRLVRIAEIANQILEDKLYFVSN